MIMYKIKTYSRTYPVVSRLDPFRQTKTRTFISSSRNNTQVSDENVRRAGQQDAY